MDVTTYSKYKTSFKIEPLIHYLQTEVPIIIPSDGSKRDQRSGGGWSIALIDGTRVVSGFNPNFGQIKAIHSYRAEIYAFIAAVLFVHLYSKHHSISIQNQCRSICDNQAYTNISNWLLEVNLYHHGFHKKTENEALQLLIQLILTQFSIQHILVHQNSNIPESELTIEEKLNISADEIATTNTKLPINTHDISSPFDVYVEI